MENSLTWHSLLCHQEKTEIGRTAVINRKAWQCLTKDILYFFYVFLIALKLQSIANRAFRRLLDHWIKFIANRNRKCLHFRVLTNKTTTFTNLSGVNSVGFLYNYSLYDSSEKKKINERKTCKPSQSKLYFTIIILKHTHVIHVYSECLGTMRNAKRNM